MTSDASRRATAALLHHLPDIVSASGAQAVFVYADALEGERLEIPEDLGDQVFYMSRTRAEVAEQRDRGTHFLRVPDVNLTRLGQVRIAVFLALSQNIVKPGDTIVCLTGRSASGTLDTLVITEAGRESEISASMQGEDALPAGVEPQVVERLVDIAGELGTEGREGKPVGAIFVVGDAERVIDRSRQLILNPFKGYTAAERNILDSALEETVKELSTIDGAFVIDGSGVIVTCGAYLKTAGAEIEDGSLPKGLGARHHAAASITAVTDSIAITVSESTGTVTVFRNGSIVTEIEKPRMPNRGDIGRDPA